MLRLPPGPDADRKRIVPRALVVLPIVLYTRGDSSAKVTRCPAAVGSRNRSERRRPLPLTFALIASRERAAAEMLAPASGPGQPADGAGSSHFQPTPGSGPSGLSMHTPIPELVITASPVRGPALAPPLALNEPSVRSMSPLTVPETERTLKLPPKSKVPGVPTV